MAMLLNAVKQSFYINREECCSSRAAINQSISNSQFLDVKKQLQKTRMYTCVEVLFICGWKRVDPWKIINKGLPSKV